MREWLRGLLFPLWEACRLLAFFLFSPFPLLFPCFSLVLPQLACLHCGRQVSEVEAEVLTEAGQKAAGKRFLICLQGSARLRKPQPQLQLQPQLLRGPNNGQTTANRCRAGWDQAVLGPKEAKNEQRTSESQILRCLSLPAQD